jgi:hypothetical protein
MPKAKTKPKQKPNRGARHVEEVLFHAGAAMMIQARAMDFEIQSEGSEDVIAMRIERILEPLAQIARSTGYISEAAQLESAGKSIGKELSSRYGMKANARDAEPGGLASDPILLQGFVEYAAESQELDPANADRTEEVYEAAMAYDKALMAALEELVEAHPPDEGATAQDLWDANGPYLVLMTLRGEGVGIWDGDWVEFYEDTEEAEEFLKKKLKKFSDGTGGGSLEEAFSNAAYQTCEGSDDDDTEAGDDEDDED